MQKLSTILSGGLAGVLAAGTALAHPGHGVAASGTPGHTLEHAAGLLASSPVAWLILAAIGFLAIRHRARRRGPSHR